MNTIKHFMLPEHTNNLYKNEAISSISLTKDVASKINELVDAYNELSKVNYEKIQEQDGKIRKGILYMKDNLINTLDDLMNQLKMSGFIDDRIISNMTELTEETKQLTARLNNLLGSVTTGSTSADAELIDLRVDYNGNIYSTAGESVRKNIDSKLDDDFLFEKGFKPLRKGQLTYNYNGSGTYISDNTELFTLNKGWYSIIVPPTNFISCIISHIERNNDVTRLVDGVPSDDISSSFKFYIPEDNYSIQVSMNVSRNTPNVAGVYVGDYYIFDAEHSPKIANYIQVDTSLLNSTTILNHINRYSYIDRITWNYTSEIPPYTQIIVDTVTLPSGAYQLVVGNTNCPTIIVSDKSDNRLADTRYNTSFTLTETTELNVVVNLSLGDPSPVGEYYVSEVCIFDDGTLLPEYLIPDITSNGIEGSYFVASQNTLATNSTMTLSEKCDVKYNKTLIFNGSFATFNGVEVGHGKGAYGGSYVKVDNDNIYIYGNNGSDYLINTYAHNLTISDYITVIVDVGVGVADVNIYTASGYFRQENVIWEGCNGSIFATSVSTSFTNPSLKWTAKDINKNIWIFGDSYLNAKSEARHPYYLYEMGYTNWLACGFPGATSTPELQSLQSLLKIGKPEIVVWCLGMNDSDNGSVNTNWINSLNSVKSLCSANNITLILATIPSCPLVDNTYKNGVVKTSGNRYIDFNSAVGVNGTAWYPGMLSSDNIHPTELGAKALARQVVIDVPEITI